MSSYEQEQKKHIATAETFRNSAFPVTLDLPYESRPGVVYRSTAKGLSKREFFAAMAMQGLCAAGYTPHRNHTLASAAVRYADELIAELQRGDADANQGD